MVKLFKKKTNFTDKEGKERTATKFYLLCGDALIPIEVTYFKSKDGKPDKAYSSRKQVLSAFAEELPEIEKKKILPKTKICPVCKREMTIDDVDGDDAIWFECVDCGISIVCRADGSEEVSEIPEIDALRPIDEDLSL